MTPRMPPLGILTAAVDGGISTVYERCFHLGYRGWPDLPLPKETEACLHAQWKDADGPVPTIDLSRPWITAPQRYPSIDLAIGFTDEHFELKYGIYTLLWDRFRLKRPVNEVFIANVCNSPRWNDEPYGGWDHVTWGQAASWIAASRCFLGCCSALHVLAVAVGTPAVVVEPNPNRQQEVFWPLGMDGERVQIVRGGDGQPTNDARHTAEAIEAVWARSAPKETEHASLSE